MTSEFKQYQSTSFEHKKILSNGQSRWQYKVFHRCIAQSEVNSISTMQLHELVSHHSFLILKENNETRKCHLNIVLNFLGFQYL